LVQKAVSHLSNLRLTKRIFVGNDNLAVDAEGGRDADDEVQVRSVEMAGGGQEAIEVGCRHGKLGGHIVEIRRPKSETRNNSESRVPKQHLFGAEFGFRPSGFLRISVFGFRIFFSHFTDRLHNPRNRAHIPDCDSRSNSSDISLQRGLSCWAWAREY